MPDRERKGVPEHRSNVQKGSLLQGPFAHPRNTDDSSIRGGAKRARSMCSVCAQDVVNLCVYVPMFHMTVYTFFGVGNVNLHAFGIENTKRPL